LKNLFLERNCLISANKLYRWSLSYRISKSTREIIFIGLNPSLSNEVFLDNTTKKIIKISFAEIISKEGYFILLLQERKNL